MDTKTVSTTQDPAARHGAESGEDSLALVLAWSSAEPQRIGEIAFVPERTGWMTLGRGDRAGDGGRAAFGRQRPGAWERRPPLGGVAISREQLRLRAHGDRLEVERVGRCAMLVDGVEADRGEAGPGSVLTLRGQLVLLCVRRATQLPAARDFAASSWGPFGEPDAVGLVGESPAAWKLRERVGFTAKAEAHVLLLGESGTGKELVAAAVHALSSRASRPMVSRNAATLPAGIVDAELFGHAKNYPNAGMPARVGLVGEADGGTLFLDEIGELGHELQAHLLRLLDAKGEYQRLGEATTRRSDLRLVAATNRAASSLKPDLLARLKLRIELPPLGERREDVPLLLHHLLLGAAGANPEIASRFVRSHDGRPTPRLDGALVQHALRREWPMNVRELDALLWRAMAASPGDTVAWSEELRDDAAPERAAPLGPDDIARAIRAAEGNVTRAARDLGLPSRFALYRLMRRHGMAVERDDPK